MKTHDKHQDTKPKTIRGEVLAFNLSPKGEIDGLLIDQSGNLSQVNFPPKLWAEMEDRPVIGESIELAVEHEPATDKHAAGHHDVYRFAEPKPGHDHPKKHGHEPDKKAKVAGVVARLNYAKHGEANGVVLDNGDFIHLKPEGMKWSGLQVGQEVTAEGEARPRIDGKRVIEAKVVNGRALAGHHA